MDNGASSYRRYLSGDEDAFGELVKEYFDNLVFFVNRFVQDYEAAEDIALDVFTRLVVDRHRYNFRVSFKTYLFMLGRSRALDYIRHRNRHRSAELSEAAQIPDAAPTPEEKLLTDEKHKALHRALEQLPEQMRLVVHLTYFEDMSADQVAKVLKKNRKQVYNLLFRAKTILRLSLEEEQ